MTSSYRYKTRTVLSSLLFFCLSANATPSCGLSVLRALNFGQYKPFRSSPDNATARIQIRCRGKGAVSYEIALDRGQSGSYFPRKMAINDGTGGQLNYNIYTKSNRVSVWGDGLGGTATKSVNKSSPFNKRHTLFGQIPARQTQVTVGTYSDVILITVNY